jgi:hypothetical protein
MQQEYFSYFSSNAKLEFEKKFYNLKIRFFYNNNVGRKEFEILSDEFTGQPSKLLVYQPMPDKSGHEWIDVSNNHDNSPLIQELGAVILKQNV